MRPTVPFMLTHPAHFIALGFGTGLAPFGPGTFGTLLAIPLYVVLAQRFTPLAILLLCVALFVIGIWACGRTARDLGVPDHGAMNWDEVVAFLVVLCFTPAGAGWIIAAFVLFRVFDILKPPPIRHLDAQLKSGFGAMIDDIFAAFYTLLVLAISRAILG
jgi:phosphatidylglycerophosphatase A